MSHPRVLIEEWLPAAAIGVECMRERSTGQQPPDKRLHVWWARRPLTASRAAVLASLLPAGFDRATFDKLLGFYASAERVLAAQRLVDAARARGRRIPNPHGPRAFSAPLDPRAVQTAHDAIRALWGTDPLVLDPMAGGGSIPFEAARLGLTALANEYNPVACTILQATIDYPYRYGRDLADATRKWAGRLLKRFRERVTRFFPYSGHIPPLTYLFARTVPCPNTGHATPLVPDWHLLKPKHGRRFVAQPLPDSTRGTWTIRVRELGSRAGMLRNPPQPTYSRGKGISLFDGTQIPADYIKAQAQAGHMGSQLYAIVTKDHHGYHFAPPSEQDLQALQAAAHELDSRRPLWIRKGYLPTEEIPEGAKTTEVLLRGLSTWQSLFSPRQLLVAGILAEELHALAPEILKTEGDRSVPILVLLSFVFDKFISHNSSQSRWDPVNRKITNAFERHDYAFRATFAEMAPCFSGSGLEWAINNVLDAYEKLASLPRYERTRPVPISMGSATHLPQFGDKSLVAVVVDPPYDDNVQYSELADFFYVWLKRLIGRHFPEWYATYLCDHTEEAVVNISRHREEGEDRRSAEAKARAFYRDLMEQTFREGHRVLRDDGVLTVMFTHKKQEAWAALFSALIRAGFQVTATWPIKTESEHSLHQAKKNAAQSTVLLVARKRSANAGTGFFTAEMQARVAAAAREAAERLERDGLNPVDQLVGAFGPAIALFSAYDEVRTDTGEAVPVDDALSLASDAVAQWRIQKLSARGLEGVEPEGRFALLCWDVLGASQFPFNEARLLGHAVGMDVEQLITAGLVRKAKSMIEMVPAKDRRRAQPLSAEEIEELTTTYETTRRPRRGRRRLILQVHPSDPVFRTALDACHALALRYLEAGGTGGLGAVKSLQRKHGWPPDSAVARLMEALVRAAPPAVRLSTTYAGKKYPEFRAWHEMLKPLFGIEPPDWNPPQETEPLLPLTDQDTGEEDESADDATED